MEVEEIQDEVIEEELKVNKEENNQEEEEEVGEKVKKIQKQKMTT
jgi:hypothetical protein